jgi:hypothetical protein
MSWFYLSIIAHLLASWPRCSVESHLPENDLIPIRFLGIPKDHCQHLHFFAKANTSIFTGKCKQKLLPSKKTRTEFPLSRLSTLQPNAT